MIKLIRSADVAFKILKCFYMTMNLIQCTRWRHLYESKPSMAKELVWAGFDMVSTANNHTGDYEPRYETDIKIFK